jgi:hypothetical protein
MTFALEDMTHFYHINIITKTSYNISLQGTKKSKRRPGKLDIVHSERDELTEIHFELFSKQGY